MTTKIQTYLHTIIGTEHVKKKIYVLWPKQLINPNLHTYMETKITDIFTHNYWTAYYKENLGLVAYKNNQFKHTYIFKHILYGSSVFFFQSSFIFMVNLFA